MSVAHIHSVAQAQQEANASAEAMVISAMLEAGQFTPERHRLDVEMLSCWEHLWRFAVEYQQVEGKAPPVELVTLKWPDFEPIYGVGLDWAVSKLREAHYQRETRRALQGALSALREGDTDALTAAIKQVQTPPAFAPARGVRTSDPSNVTDKATLTGYAWPWQSLQQGTMGLVPGELVYLAARYGQGKSNDAAFLAAWWAEMGLRVRFVSLEMRKQAVARRINRCHARGDADLRKALTNPDANVREAALMALHAKITGWVEVIDPSDMNISTRTISAACQDVDLVIVDHTGILKDAKGRKPIEDWRVFGEVSNTLRDISLSETVPIVALAQLNREGDVGGTKMATSKTLGGSDALGQDADMILILKLLGERAQRWTLDKNREGPGFSWYTQYEPTHGAFAEISKDEALTRMREDDERRADD